MAGNMVHEINVITSRDACSFWALHGNTEAGERSMGHAMPMCEVLLGHDTTQASAIPAAAVQTSDRHQKVTSCRLKVCMTFIEAPQGLLRSCRIYKQKIGCVLGHTWQETVRHQ